MVPILVNKIIINVEKTKAVVISTKQKQTKSIDNFNLNLIMNNSKLSLNRNFWVS